MATVVLSAIPTAYSGASGIFVIAAGAVIFEQLRNAGPVNEWRSLQQRCRVLWCSVTSVFGGRFSSSSQ